MRPSPPKDSDLAFIQHYWPEISPEIRNAITDMVHASVQLQERTPARKSGGSGTCRRR